MQEQFFQIRFTTGLPLTCESINIHVFPSPKLKLIHVHVTYSVQQISNYFIDKRHVKYVYVRAVVIHTFVTITTDSFCDMWASDTDI